MSRTTNYKWKWSKEFLDKMDKLVQDIVRVQKQEKNERKK